jgi:hypothetical protein
VVEHASTLVYCCFLTWSVTAAAVLLAKNIVPLVITCKAYSVFMLLLCLTTVILAAIDVLKRFHVVEHASTLVYCCFLIWSVTAAAVLLAKNIVPFLVRTCKAHDVFMLLLCLTTEILADIDVWKEISCG